MSDLDDAKTLEEDLFGYVEPVPSEATRNWKGWYDNLPAVPGMGTGPWPNATSVASTLCDQYGLIEWKQAQVAFGLSKDPAALRVAQGARFKRNTPHGKKVLRDLVQRAHDLAESSKGADFGSAFHALVETLERGENPNPLKITDDQIKMINAYIAVRRGEKIFTVPGMVERVVFNREFGLAGKFDEIADHRGVTKIGDTKTQREYKDKGPFEYSHISIPAQLAIYANADFILDRETWTWQPMPEVSRTEGIVTWIPATEPGRAEIHRVDLDWGWKMVKASMKTWEWRTDRSRIVRIA